MRLKQYLTELAAKKAKVEVRRAGSGEFKTDIQTDAGSFEFDAAEVGYNFLTTKFTKDANEYREFVDRLVKANIVVWSIAFYDPKGEISVAPKEKGISLQVFAGVEESFKLFMKKYSFDVLHFSSFKNEPSKIKLYDLLAKRISKQGYTKYKKTLGGFIIYWIFANKKANEILKDYL
jgi:hypothetical protein